MASSSIGKVLAPDYVIQSLSRKAKKALQEMKKVDPRTRHVILFPDSSSAHNNMAFKLLNIKPAEKVFQQASDLLKRDFLKICINSDSTELLSNLETRSLATYITSHATLEKLRYDLPHVFPLAKAAGGLGVGFINCLVLSGSMTFEDGLDLVQRRAKAMDKAASIVPSALIKVKVKPATRLKVVCQAAIEHCLQKNIPPEIAKCSVTKQYQAHLVEIGGHEEAIKYLEAEGLETFNFRFVKRLPDTPAFHTELMKPSQEYIKEYIKHRQRQNSNYIQDPQTCSVYSATCGKRCRYADDIISDIRDYPVKPILTEQLIHLLFHRPKSLAQPNIHVIWDRKLLNNLAKVNLPAHRSAKLFS